MKKVAGKIKAKYKGMPEKKQKWFWRIAIVAVCTAGGVPMAPGVIEALSTALAAGL